ncbi:ABC transporter ATP-binding protein [Acidisoma silvae]|uniref:ABC transporter ATP-binding protein n=1 Tax=Acidisoma silvae TaxID=2802396 RepID=A0A964E1Q0_9PROT|nr:ABC transporter ATP-binding protein [Acidisoma silvae]MCB8877998.1 ABC transporter ATP-binding protein [Acidisoma silvae]
MTLLSVETLSRSFGGIQAVRDVSFTLAEGETVGVIGPNGAGKTTLFNLLSGHERPDSGRVAFAGREITGWAPERLIGQGLARTFQHGRVFANLSVLDNVLIGASARLRYARPNWSLLGPLGELLRALLQPPAVRAEEAALQAEAQTLLHRFGERLAPRANHPAHSLSYANRRRVEIARALAARPRLLLLDEPAAGMNESETLELQHLLLDLKTQGQTMLLIEHKLDLVMQLCDRVIVMDDGAVIAAGTAAEVRRDPAVIRAYLGDSAAAKGEFTQVPEVTL